MKKIIRYNPSISTLNLGDQIISESIKYELANLFKDAFIVDISSHLPISYIYSNLIADADYKFVCGTNLLMGKLNGIFRQWDINIFNAKKLGPVTLIGTGWWQYNNLPNLYTKKVYKKILSDNYIHSVRDNYTKQMLNEMGFDNVINTACPTMWRMTPEFCKEIPTKKSNRVITTITDYKQDIEKDNEILDILCNEYDEVFLWLQGIGDYDYFKQLKVFDKIKIITPNLEAYDNLLKQDDIDYVGSRLHGGVRALQFKKRSIIIATDNRAIEKQKDFNLPVIKREDIHNLLAEKINSSFSTEIKIPIDNINLWKKQFKELI